MVSESGFRTAASAHVEPVDTVAALERLLGEADDVSRVGRAFQSMQEDDLPTGGSSG